jgi:hypothetical protein
MIKNMLIRLKMLYFVAKVDADIAFQDKRDFFAENCPRSPTIAQERRKLPKIAENSNYVDMYAGWPN